MICGIASDHGGFKLKEAVKNEFLHINWKDMGCFSEESVDYPDYIAKLAKAILNNEFDKGIAICGTGIGASIMANRFTNIRAALCHNEFTAEMSRKHNDANILVLGGRVLKNEEAYKIIKIFFNTEFEGGRHENRIKKIENLCL
ncbi:MAG: ribose 5-phosphate isomerase B [Spirochaetia bacterium]|nr:ribose 5-phosphate isomerase B [Spirochaetia bacterium]